MNKSIVFILSVLVVIVGIGMIAIWFAPVSADVSSHVIQEKPPIKSRRL